MGYEIVVRFCREVDTIALYDIPVKKVVGGASEVAIVERVNQHTNS